MRQGRFPQLVDSRTFSGMSPDASWVKPCASEPDSWNHDVLRPDGSAYAETEVAFVRSLTR